MTGASTGIGFATTKALIAAGYHVYGSVRKQHDLESFESELSSSFTPLILDVTDEEAIKAAAQQARSSRFCKVIHLHSCSLVQFSLIADVDSMLSQYL